MPEITLKQFLAALPSAERAAIEQRAREIGYQLSRHYTVFAVVKHGEKHLETNYPVGRHPSDGEYTTFPSNANAEIFDAQEAGEAVTHILQNTMNVIRIEVWTNGRR